MNQYSFISCAPGSSICIGGLKFLCAPIPFGSTS